jgi:hypothetical protein
MDKRLVKEFWRLMENKDVSKFLLAVFLTPSKMFESPQENRIGDEHRGSC